MFLCASVICLYLCVLSIALFSTICYNRAVRGSDFTPKKRKVRIILSSSHCIFQNNMI